MPLEQENDRFSQLGYQEDTIMETYQSEHATVDTNTKFTTSPAGVQPFKGKLVLQSRFLILMNDAY